jgi:hypothetical protein
MRFPAILHPFKYPVVVEVGRLQCDIEPREVRWQIGVEG